jgi:hypothetical protein
MANNTSVPPASRQALFQFIGTVVDSTAIYSVMAQFEVAQGYGYPGCTNLGATRTASTYHEVEVLEIRSRPGGRNWTLSPADNYTDLEDATREGNFDDRKRFDSCPWRVQEELLNSAPRP